MLAAGARPAAVAPVVVSASGVRGGGAWVEGRFLREEENAACVGGLRQAPLRIRKLPALAGGGGVVSPVPTQAR